MQASAELHPTKDGSPDATAEQIQENKNKSV
jgi:hypothetical protein